MLNKKEKVFLNAYLAENLGDDLFVQVITHRYKQTVFSILASKSYKGNFSNNVIYEIDENDERKIKIENKIINILSYFHLPVRRILPKGMKVLYRKREKLSRSCDHNVYVIGSGFMERGVYLNTEFRTDLKYFSRNVHLLGCNFGPYETDDFLNKHTILFEKAAEVCFRDKESFYKFENLNNTRCCMDIVFNYDLGEEYILPQDFDNYTLISVISVNKDGETNHQIEEKYLEFITDCIKNRIESGYNVVLIGFCKQQGDDLVIQKLLNRQKSQENILAFNYPDVSYKEVMGLFANAREVIATRYHAMILAMLYKKRVYTISYSNKTSNVLLNVDENAKFAKLDSIDNVEVDDFLKEYGYTISDKTWNILKQSAKEQFLQLDDILK